MQILSDSPTSMLRQLLFIALYNTAIAFFITLLGGEWKVSLIFSHCIGTSIFFLQALGTTITRSATGLKKLTVTIASIVSGALFGTYAALHFLGWSKEKVFGNDFLNPVLLGLLFGSIISYFYYSRIRIAEATNQAQQEQLQRLEGEKELAQAQLKLVQAQIEPHFLFNTLANISGYIEQDPGTAKKMLDHLNRYLRTSLDRTREGKTSLGQEGELLQAYLSIMRTRMGGRLHFDIDIPDNLAALPLPPLLIQPLVENAVRHGLEPKISGGRISIVAAEAAGNVCITVEDDGVGLKNEMQPGTGLENIYQRLKTLYGDTAHLDSALPVSQGDIFNYRK